MSRRCSYSRYGCLSASSDSSDLGSGSLASDGRHSLGVSGQSAIGNRQVSARLPRIERAGACLVGGSDGGEP